MHHELIEYVWMVSVHAKHVASLNKKNFNMNKSLETILSYSGFPSSISQEKNVWCSCADKFISWNVNGSFPLYCVKRWYSAPRNNAQGFFQTLHSFVPVTGVVESIPFDKPLVPLELSPPLVNDDEDGKDKSLLINEELLDSLPFKIGVKWLIDTCSINDVPYRLKYHHSNI